MQATSFGQALGILIRQKRLAQGLTQLQLAEDAFQTSGKTRRISELESGSVSNPHPKTIDPIIATLGITVEELEDCARTASVEPNEELDRAYREARNLIDAVAKQFEHDKPDASLGELDDFLRAKAREWALLRDRFAGIDCEVNDIIDLKKQASLALADGRLEDVDLLLEQAEERFQKKRTIGEVKKYAEIRIARGDGSLFGGDAEGALRHYTAAVEFFRPFDEREMADSINGIAHRVYEISRRSLRPIFFVGASLLEILITLESVKADRRAMAAASFRIGLSYRNEHDDPTSLRKKEALSKAIEFSRLALDYSDEDRDTYRIVSSTIGLANCLRDRGKMNSDLGDLQQAVGLLVSVQRKYENDYESNELMPHLFNSLGAIYRNIVRIKKDASDDANVKAVGAFSEAIKASEKQSNIDVWGASRFNLGSVLAERAEAVEPDDKYFTRLRAIAEINAALETFPSVTFPYRFAEAHSLLGQILADCAEDLDDEVFVEGYLLRAVHSFEVAANFIGKERQPVEWAHLRMRLARVFCLHSTIADKEIALNDLATAVEIYGEALPMLEGNKRQAEADACRTAISGAEKLRGQLLAAAE